MQSSLQLLQLWFSEWKKLRFLRGVWWKCIFISNQKTRDYHTEMNRANFIRRLNENLITNLAPNSVLVMDNASYHNTQGQSPKVEFKLGNCRIGYVVGTLLFCSTMLKVHLLHNKIYKSKQKRALCSSGILRSVEW